MNRLLRVLLLGAVAFGIVLALTAAPSSGGTRGQSGYGDDTVPPRELETSIGENAGSSGGGGGSNTGLILGLGAGIIVLGGGAAFAYSRLNAH
jgi:hypothetical protein